MAFKYTVGDILTHHMGTNYTVTDRKVNNARVRVYRIASDDGRDMWRSANVLENPKYFQLYKKAASAHKQFPDIDIDGALIKHETTHLVTITRKSLCDCGGHKLGYADDQLFGHGSWCKLVQLSKEKAS